MLLWRLIRFQYVCTSIHVHVYRYNSTLVLPGRAGPYMISKDAHYSVDLHVYMQLTIICTCYLYGVHWQVMRCSAQSRINNYACRNIVLNDIAIQ